MDNNNSGNQYSSQYNDGNFTGSNQSNNDRQPSDNSQYNNSNPPYDSSSQYTNPYDSNNSYNNNNSYSSNNSYNNNNSYSSNNSYSNNNSYNNNNLNSSYNNNNFNNQYNNLEEPVSMKEWAITYLILLIPCVNIVMMFIWAFSKTEKKSKSNYFKITLIVIGIILVLYVILIAIWGVALFSSLLYMS